MSLQLLPLKGLYERALAMVLHHQMESGHSYEITNRHYTTRNYQKFPFPNKWLKKKVRRQVNYMVPYYSSKLPNELIDSMGQNLFPKKLKLYLLQKHTKN